MIKKPQKSELSKDLLNKLSLNCGVDIPNDIDCIVVDFMQYARKIPIKKIIDKGGALSTFGYYFKLLSDIFNSLSRNANDLHIIFDLYEQFSIKSSERRRRGKDGSIKVSISSDSQKLPGDMNQYWRSSENKVCFQ